jgi:hypothetical protein
MLKSGEREILKWKEKMRNVNVEERERRGMRVKDMERKKRECGEREEKKGREKHMNGFKVWERKIKKVKKNNYLQVEFLGQ